MVRATSLSNYPRLVADLGADPGALLAAAGLDATVAGRSDVFVPLPRVVAAIESGTVAATQFHPEKSGQAGIRLLRNWLNTL